MTIAEIIMLIRGIPDKSSKMDQPEWDKSAKGKFCKSGGRILDRYEYRKPTATNDAKKNWSLEMRTKCKTQKAPSLADVVTLHIDGR